ncbi:MAG: endonuclease domain-containing protein [SAR202 cluster bacterium]|nr:endonuclease domain-containing protein [SAR202 cluster bacterium]
MSKKKWSPKSLSKARWLRKRATDAEQVLWIHLHDRRLAGFKFYRQEPIGPFVADFVCRSHKLIIELDGGQHLEQATYDSERDGWLRERGYGVLRVWNTDVFTDLESVKTGIWLALMGHDGAPSPLGRGQAASKALSPDGARGRRTPLRRNRGVEDEAAPGRGRMDTNP